MYVCRYIRTHIKTSELAKVSLIGWIPQEGLHVQT